MESHTRTLTRQIIMSFFHSFFFFSLSFCNFLFDLEKKNRQMRGAKSWRGQKKIAQFFLYISHYFCVCFFSHCREWKRYDFIVCANRLPIAYRPVWNNLSSRFTERIFNSFPLFCVCSMFRRFNFESHTRKKSRFWGHFSYDFLTLRTIPLRIKKKSKEMKEEKSHKHRKMSFSLLFAKKIALVSSSLRFNCQYLSHARNFIFGISFDAISYRLSFFIAIYFQNKKKEKKIHSSCHTNFQLNCSLCYILFSIALFFFTDFIKSTKITKE